MTDANKFYRTFGKSKLEEKTPQKTEEIEEF